MEESVLQKDIRGKEARFNNRKRKDGWLSPSARQLLEAHLFIVKEVLSFVPITKVIIEENVFDFQKLENPQISGAGYQHGPLFGFESERDYLEDKQDGVCLMCGKKATQTHHGRPRSEGGSNSIKNKARLCDDCHERVHKDEAFRKEFEKKVKGCGKKRVSLLNSVFPRLLEELEKLCSSRSIELETTTGKETSLKRDLSGIEKTHADDAYLISLGGGEIESFDSNGPLYEYRRYKKKSNSLIHKVGSRKYYHGGKLVATNRHKAMAQKAASLEDYKKVYLKEHSPEEWEEHFRELEVVPAKRVYTYHKKGINPRFHTGDLVRYEKITKAGKVSYSGVARVTGLSLSQNLLHLDNGKHPNLKYCSFLKGGAFVCLGRIKETDKKVVSS